MKNINKNLKVGNYIDLIFERAFTYFGNTRFTTETIGRCIITSEFINNSKEKVFELGIVEFPTNIYPKLFYATEKQILERIVKGN